MKQLVLIIVLTCGLNAFSQVTFTDSDLPIVVINTENSAPIVDDPRVVAQMGIIYNGPGVRNYMTDPWNNYNGRIEIEIRGSTSQQYPKKGYGFETQLSDGSNNNVVLLGLPKENDWILYGPYPDKTCLRNTLTFDLAREMGNYASRTVFCELVINGDYRGLYVLMERLKIDNDRIDLEDVHEANIVGDSLTGGYVVKVDKLTGEVGYTWESLYDNEVLFQFHDPEFDEISVAQASYMEDYIGDFENAIFGPNMNDSALGWPQYIRGITFIDFFIIQELGRTVDGYRSSSFMFKEKNGPSWNSRLEAGPMWDFNLSYGNADYCGANTTTGWQYNFDLICDFNNSIPFWWERLLDSPAYTTGLMCRWEQLRQGFLETNTINNYIDSLANYIEEARIRNFQRWPIIGVYVNWNGFVGQTYQEDLDYLKWYIEQRSLWLDANIPGSCVAGYEYEDNFVEEYHRAWPNPFTNDMYVGFTLFSSSDVRVEVRDLSGRIVEVQDLGQQNPGKHTVEFNDFSSNSGSYIYTVIGNEKPIYTGKIVKIN